MKILGFAFLILAIAGCNDPGLDCCAGPTEVSLGEPFSITEGETVDVAASIVNIKFTQLVSDSLCPEDVECVTQGTLAIVININGTDKNLSIGDANNPQTEYKEYIIELQKLIYPTSQDEKANINSTYAVQMTITRQ
ncbi:MAG: hypothetical protein ABJF04_18865 [Reichenbachiella sp.]|uniref:hypothetical protein n=1 Tax=Reichenbachiella sp. TaxID=2184521 RepID=UPI003266FD4A